MSSATRRVEAYRRCGELTDRLRISALSKATVSPRKLEVTIGPNSRINKEEYLVEPLEAKTASPSESAEDLLVDTLADDLRYTLRLKHYENIMQEHSELVYKNLIERMVAKRSETMQRYWMKQTEESKKRSLELKARKLQMLKLLQDNDNMSVLEKAKQDEKISQMINQQTLETMNKILEEQNKATARFACITNSHTKICICYNEINSLLHSDPHAKTVCDKYIVTLNTVIGNINSILDLCKVGSIADKDVQEAEILATNIENIRQKIVNDVNTLKQEEINEYKQVEEEERKRKAEEQKALKEKALLEKEAQNIVPQPPTKTKPLYYSQKNYTYFEKLKHFLYEYEKLYKDLLENTNLKKFRFDCQKAVSTPVNAISSVSGSHIKDKFEKLSKLLRGERVQVLDTYVQATQHPQGLFYVTALLAKKIVLQGDRLVSSNPEAAFPLASVTVALWSQFPEFGKLLEAYFHRECPYLVPMFLPQKQGQTDKEFYRSRGYTYNEEGVVEKQDKFLKRMTGIFRLRCAIWIAKTPKFLPPNPHGMRHGWQWLASFINLKPEPDISATLIHDFFTVCGAEYYKTYGMQFMKIIRVIASDFLKILENIDEGGPKTRLEVFLQNVMKSGHIPPPNGMLAPNIW